MSQNMKQVISDRQIRPLTSNCMNISVPSLMRNQLFSVKSHLDMIDEFCSHYLKTNEKKSVYHKPSRFKSTINYQN